MSGQQVVTEISRMVEKCSMEKRTWCESVTLPAMEEKFEWAPYVLEEEVVWAPNYL